MHEIVSRLSSRKFILVVAPIVTAAAGLLTADQLELITPLILAFLAAEGAADTAERWQSEKTKQSQIDLTQSRIISGDYDDPIDRSEVVAGDGNLPL